MSKQHPINISSKLQQLIEKANCSFPSTGEAVNEAYRQALGEGYTPRQAKNVLYDNIHFLHERTIRRYMPSEAKDTEKIRILNGAADNDLQNLKQNDIETKKATFPNSKKLGRQTNLENTISDSDSADVSTVNNMNHSKNSTETILRLQDTVKKNNAYTIELLNHNIELQNENQRLKEDIDKNKTKNIVPGRILVDVTIPALYREVLHLKLNNVPYGRIVIDGGRYVKLEPRNDSPQISMQ